MALMATASPDDSHLLYVGFIGCAVAGIFFGSNYVPVKKYKTGDGMFFQWVLCVSIWCTGVCVNLFAGNSTFYPLAMLGGFLWATGNVCVVPIFKTVGMTIGLLTWSAFNLLSGWASGRFGFFGLQKQIPPRPVLNYIGVVCALVSVFIYVTIKPHVDGADSDDPQTTERNRLNTLEDKQYLVHNDVVSLNTGETTSPPPIATTSSQGQDIEISDESFLDLLSPKKKKILGFSLSVVSGLMYGVTFIPVIYIKDNYPGSSQTDINYVLSHFSGILLTSTSYLLIYCAYMRNKPKVYPEVLAPGIISGVMWAIAQSGWFVANQYLSEAVSFPIITTLPGIVASLWGVLVFKEIRGRRNLLLLGLAFIFVITGSTLSGLSKIPD